MRGIRYAIQAAVMAFDLLIIGSGSYLIWEYPRSAAIWLLVGFVFLAWHKQGGLMSWNPGTARQFLANAKKNGW